MFGTEFGEKCIIMQFLGAEEDGKHSRRRDAEKRFESTEREKEEDSRSENVSYTPGHSAEKALWPRVSLLSPLVA
jgi:hypothetical protein